MKLNLKTTNDGSKIQWLKVKHIAMHRNCADIYMRYDFDAEFMIIPLIKEWKGRRSTKQITVDNLLEYSHPNLYDKRLPISQSKKKDLLSLCTSGIVPPIYKAYYDELPTSEAAKDRLLLTDITESDCDTDTY